MTRPLTTQEQCAALSAQLPKRDWTKADIGSVSPVYDHKPEDRIGWFPDAEHKTYSKREFL